LILRGQADYSWVNSTLRLGRFVPGVNKLDSSALSTEVDLGALQAPDSVSLSYKKGIIIAQGNASYKWMKAAEKTALSLPGVRQLDISNLSIEIDTSLLSAPKGVAVSANDGILKVAGKAPHEWILQARQISMQIPGVTRYDDSELQDLDLIELETSIADLEKEIILFGVNAIAHPQQHKALLSTTATARALLQLGNKLEQKIHIQILGHSDSSGDPQRNFIISQQRADFVYGYLIANGVPADSLSAVGVADRNPLTEKIDEQGKQMNRSVTFIVDLTPALGDGS